MAKKKRQTLTIVILCAVLLCLVIGYLISYAVKKQRLNDAEEEILLLSVQAEDVVEFCYTNAEADVTLVKENDTWKLKEDADFPVKQSLVESLLSDAVNVSATRLVTESCSDLSEYELDSPKLTVALTDANGDTYTIAYGLETTAAGGTYVYTDSKKVIYVADSNTVSEFSYTKNQLMQLPDAPEIDDSRVLCFYAETADGAYFSARALSDPESRENAKETDEQDETDEDADTDDWEIDKSTGTVTDYDTDSMEEITYALSYLCAEEGVNYKTDEKELEMYGLTEPAATIIVDYYTVETAEDEDGQDGQDIYTDHTYKVCVGDLDDTGYYYYVTLADENADIAGIYLADSDTIDELLSVVP